MLSIRCPVCEGQVSLESVVTKKGKSCLMMVCVLSGSHYRGFINDQDYIAEFARKAEAATGIGSKR